MDLRWICDGSAARLPSLSHGRVKRGIYYGCAKPVLRTALRMCYRCAMCMSTVPTRCYGYAMDMLTDLPNAGVLLGVGHGPLRVGRGGGLGVMLGIPKLCHCMTGRRTVPAKRMRRIRPNGAGRISATDLRWICDGSAMDLRRICDGSATDLQWICDGSAVGQPSPSHGQTKRGIYYGCAKPVLWTRRNCVMGGQWVHAMGILRASHRCTADVLRMCYVYVNRPPYGVTDMLWIC